jgi:DNA-binding NarL/FixJ family response regulator
VAQIRILIVDDHAVVREGLSSMLSRQPDLEIVGEAACGDHGLSLVRELSPDIMLLDLQMPGMHGLEVLSQLAKSGPEDTRVVVLSVVDEPELVLRAVRGGAQGYVLKSASRSELVAAIRRVAAGGQSFDEVVVRAFLTEKEKAASAELLTERETEILRLIATGCRNQSIAEQLYMSVSTVKGHLDDAYRKLGVSDRAHAVAVALRLGLLE